VKLAERDEELAALRDSFASSLEAHGNVVLISGAAASGKSALLHTFAEQVGRAGAVFLDARASRTERNHSFGVMSQLFRSVERSAENSVPGTHSFTGGAFNPALLERAPEVAEGIRSQVPRELYLTLLDLAERNPVVIGVDDMHYIDLPSFECLLYLVRRLRSTRILIVLTECVRRRRAHPHFLAELLSQPHCRHIRLNLLSQCGVARILAETTGGRWARDLAPAWHKVTGGNPLLVHALLEDNNISSKAAPTELAVGAAFGQAVMSCLYRSGLVACAVADALAIMDERASLPVIAEVLERDVESVIQASNVLDSAGLLSAGRFRHDNMRLAVLDTMLPEERADMHGRAAHVLHSHGTTPTVLADHLVAADRVQAKWALPVLVQSAEEALGRGDLDQARVYLRRAYEMSTGDRQRATVKAAFARVEWRCSPAAVARHLPELVTHALADRLSWRQVAGLAGYLLWHGQVESAVDMLEAVERRTGGLDAETALDIDIARLWLCSMFPELLGRLRPDRAVAAPEDSASVRGAELLRSATVLTAVLTGCMDDDALIGADQVLQGPLRDDATLASMMASMAALIYANKLDKATFWCDSLLREAEERNAPTWQALFAAIRATIDVRLGRMADAARSARTAMALISARGWGVVIGMPLAAALLATTALGRYEEAASYLSLLVPEATFRTPFGLHYLQARGRYYLATGRIQAALGDFQACGDLMVKWGLDLPTIVPWRTDAARALLALGKIDQARGLANEQLARLSPGHSRTRGLSLRILAATSAPHERTALLAAAMDELQDYGDRFELALTAAELSSTHHELGDDGRARVLADRARRLAAECGIEPSGNLPPELTQVMGGAPAPDSAQDDPVAELSDAERRVARLAARGQKNRQIADQLSITVSTVEQHLTRVYRKLKIGRRIDLKPALQPAKTGPERAE
jgi:DNA-binding CsgD family transcriptional regulator